jgi:hypothetical protein
MIGHQVPAAFLAVLALAGRILDEGRDVLPAFGDAHSTRLPESERVDRARRPRAAGAAMAVAHRLWLALDFDLDASAEARAFVGHDDLLKTELS